MTTITTRKNSILAINGDYYGFRKTGIVIGNSKIYRNNPISEFTEHKKFLLNLLDITIIQYFTNISSKISKNIKIYENHCKI